MDLVANNFWGKDDAGVGPLLERMHNAKVTSDELKSFYTGMISRLRIDEILTSFDSPGSIGGRVCAKAASAKQKATWFA